MTKLSSSNRSWILSAVAFSAVCVGLAYRLGVARGAGIPPSAALYYAGTVVESGVPVTGLRDISVNVYDDPTAVGGTHLQCGTATTGTTVAGGRFRIALADSCVAVIHSNPNLWIEVVVGGVSLGRAKVGATPFAVETDHAVKADALTTPITAAQVDATIAKSQTLLGVYVADQPYSASGAFSNPITGTCKPGDLPMGGGCSIDTGSSGGVGLSYPAGAANSTPTGWTCVFQNGSPSTLSGHVRVICLPKP